MNVLELRGPAFLQFYGLLLAVAAIALVALRLLLRRSDARDEPRLDTFELALLADGETRVTMLAVATLVDRGRATLRAGRLTFTGHALGPNVHPIERTLISERPATLRDARRAIREPVAAMRRALESEGLLVNSATRSVYQAIVFAGAVGLLAIGGAKIAVGLSRDRPVGILVGMTLATAVVALLAIVRPPFRSTGGDSLLRRRRLDRPKSKSVSSKAPILPDTDAGTSVALHGLAAMSLHPAYGDFRSAFAGNGGGWIDTSSSSGSGCGGSSCGGGGGCGGGGCGGCGS